MLYLYYIFLFFFQLFIAQYHIWLADDTHKLLVILPQFPVLNVVLTTFVFVCAAHEINIMTAKLVSYFIPDELKALLRNLLAIFLMLAVCAVLQINGL